MHFFYLAAAVLWFSVVADLHIARSASAAPAKGVQVKLFRNRAVIANEFLALEYSLPPRGARTSRIRNLRAGKSLSLEGEDFILELIGGEKLTSSEFRVDDCTQESSGRSGKRLLLDFGREGWRVRMVTEMRPGEWWATRWLEIRGAGGQLASVTLARWPVAAAGPTESTKPVKAPGYPNSRGQALYAADLFLGIAHPGAENFAGAGSLSCRIAAWDPLEKGKTVTTQRLVIGAGESGAARRAFLGYIDATRATPARMLFLVNDWYWKDKSKPLAALEALAQVKRVTGVPIDSFTLDDGWDFDWDEETGIWGRLNRRRFPGAWEALAAAGRAADIGISLWFGPIGGYSYRPKRIEFARKAGFELNGDKLCLAGIRYRAHVIESFKRWAALGMDYIKVDGFWPDCRQTDHGHPTGAAGAIAQTDSLMEVFAAWRQARPGLLIGYTSGSNPSPFWLQHADFLWRGGVDDNHAGAGEPFDRHNTFLDMCLQEMRQSEVPISAFVTFDIVQDRIVGNRDDAFERGFWWLAARSSLHHDWYLQASDLPFERWQRLAIASRWAREQEKLFRWSRMIGGDPGKGECYGFASFDGGRGTLALRNPGTEPRSFENTPAAVLALPDAQRSARIRLHGVYGYTQPLEGEHSASAPIRIELPPLAIAVFEVRAR